MKNTLNETRLDRIERNLESFFIGMQELKESQKRTDAQLSRTDAQLQKTIKKLDDIGYQLGDMGLVQGEVAEELFYRNVTGLFLPMDMRFARIRRNVKVKGFGEYDIVADDEGRVLVIEVKNKLSKRLVDEFMQKKLPRFKTLNLKPDYQPKSVNTDGWEHTQRAWKDLFTGIAVILCFLHAFLNGRTSGMSVHGASFHKLADMV
jgi:hypothetical protein